MRNQTVRIFYSAHHKKHNPPYEIYDGIKEPYAERKERLVPIVNSLQNDGYKLENPKRFPEKEILRVHQAGYVRFLKIRSHQLQKNQILYPSYFILDTYAPVVAGTYSAARSSVDVALTGANVLLQGERAVYSLCRPPGHHAEKHAMSGYCYFNNAAIAADYLSEHGKVAVLDIDFHHGNGTQRTFYERNDVLYVSLHADPEVKFPYISGFRDEKGKGVGLGFNRNYPLPLGTDDISYLKVLKKALRDVVNFNPTYLVVSLGFDTYDKDPIGGFKLSILVYKTIAQQIKELKLPTLLVQEGGYHVSDLGKMASSFLQGFQES